MILTIGLVRTAVYVFYHETLLILTYLPKVLSFLINSNIHMITDLRSGGNHYSPKTCPLA